jgi:type IV secretory pathway TrbD component
MTEPVRHPVYRSLHKPLTVLGAERRLFFMAVGSAALLWDLFSSFLVSLLLFLILHVLAFVVTKRDPELLQIILKSGGLRARYDPAKWSKPN